MIDQSQSLLGKTVAYPERYNPDILHGIDRATGRESFDTSTLTLPFFGADKWTGYELCWLDQNGKPNVGIVEIVVPCNSPKMVESKSLKLYLHSLNEKKFDSHTEVRTTIAIDLKRIVGAEVVVDIFSIDQYAEKGLHKLAGICLDDLELAITASEPNHELLSVIEGNVSVNENVYSHLLRSNCPVTGQPDWASVQVNYRGRAISHQSLLSYLVSFRRHDAFHEHCAEKIFADIRRQCKPDSLTVITRYTRRGGIDINPWRSTESDVPRSLRLSRQ